MSNTVDSNVTDYVTMQEKTTAPKICCNPANSTSSHNMKTLFILNTLFAAYSHREVKQNVD